MMERYNQQHSEFIPRNSANGADTRYEMALPFCPTAFSVYNCETTKGVGQKPKLQIVQITQDMESKRTMTYFRVDREPTDRNGISIFIVVADTKY